MKNISHKIWQFLSGTNFQTVLTFFVAGLLAGAVFTWLTRLPLLENFFFISAPKFPVARFSWWAAFSLFPALGIIAGFLASERKAGLIGKLRLTFTRSLVAFALMISAIPLCYVFVWTASPLIEEMFLILATPFIFLAMCALAMCVATRSLRLLPIAFLASFLFTVVGCATYLLTAPLLREQSGKAVEFSQWTFLFASLSGSFGCWLVWQIAASQRTAKRRSPC